MPELQVPPPQTSWPLQTVASSHALVLLECSQPDAGLQLSVVQTLWSSQSSAVPELQVPPPQTSWPLQTVASSHALVLLECSQPDAGLQLSVVQTLWSSQSSAVPELQVPPPQTSWPLQTVASSHALVLLECAQPEAGLQLSVVQTLWSSQFKGVGPTHVPPEHASLVVHALPSLQVVPAATLLQEVVETLGWQDWHALAGFFVWLW